MDLDRAGVELGKQRQILTDRHLRTTSPHIFAAGDCTTHVQFTHVGDEQGRLAATNAFASSRLLPGIAGGPATFDDSVVPWVTFTDPEVGRVGMTEQQAFTAYGARARVAVVSLEEMDRPRTAGHHDGYLKLIAGPRKVARFQVLDQVVGFTAVTPVGGELAAQVALATRTGMLADRLAQTIAPYPTYALGLRLAAARLFGDFGARPGALPAASDQQATARAMSRVTELAEQTGLAVEGLGVLVIVASVAVALAVLLWRSAHARTRQAAYQDTRRCLGRGILLGLEVLVAGDIIRTVAVTPTLGSVTVLAIIVLVRTFLSFVLTLEIEGRWPWQPKPGPAETETANTPPVLP